MLLALNEVVPEGANQTSFVASPEDTIVTEPPPDALAAEANTIF